MQQLKFGILGFGKHASRVMLPAINQSKNCTLSAVGTNSGRSDLTSQVLDQEVEVFSSYAELVNSSGVEAVYISLPNSMHCEWTLRALDCGKHVLCEKPLAMSQSDADKMSTRAQESGLALLEALMIRFHPIHARVEEMIRSGEIGSIKRLESDFTYELHEANNIRAKPELGGGASYDTLCYHLETCRRFLGLAPVDFHSEAVIQNGLDVEAKYTLSYPSGVSAVLYSSLRSPNRHSYRIVGTKGTISVPKAYLISRLSHSEIEILKPKHPTQKISVPAENQYVNMIETFAYATAQPSILDPFLTDSAASCALTEQLIRSIR
ncbi:MAG: Gfo/Idh/MocA family oxidoreductase [Bdellovibrionales bacterium]|nr:Gfo/Idh/MocA family oxidoreductase [Bdellovibrionales bacterium]